MSLTLRVMLRLASIPVAVWLLLLLPAGSFAFWQAYTYFGIMTLLSVAATIYFLNRNPEALRQRLESREKEPEQRRIMAVSLMAILALYVLAGFDQRFAWSSVPVWVSLAAHAVAVMGYLIMLVVLHFNSHASRTIKVDEGQKLVDSGPYSVIRHPMYDGAILLCIATPVALGSYVALLPVPVIVVMLIFRTLNEEKVMLRDLPGYDDYCRKVSRRLIPGIW